MDSFENYYVAFIDILGFKDLMKKKTQEEIAEIFEKLVLKRDTLLKEFGVVKLYIRIMSDSIIIACDEKKIPSLLAVCFCCGEMQSLLLEQGILVRGGISSGEFYEKEEITFGKALVNAYNLESGYAIYPRIVVEAQLIQEYVLRTNDSRVVNGLHAILEKDEDEFYYLDFMCMHCVAKEYDKRLNDLRKLIVDNLIKANTPLKVREKYIWLKREYNGFISRNRRFKNYAIGIDIFSK